MFYISILDTDTCRRNDLRATLSNACSIKSMTASCLWSCFNSITMQSIDGLIVQCEVKGLRIYLQSSVLSYGREKFTRLITEGAMQQSGFRWCNETPAEIKNKRESEKKRFVRAE